MTKKLLHEPPFCAWEHTYLSPSHSVNFWFSTLVPTLLYKRSMTTSSWTVHRLVKIILNLSENKRMIAKTKNGGCIEMHWKDTFFFWIPRRKKRKSNVFRHYPFQESVSLLLSTSTVRNRGAKFWLLECPKTKRYAKPTTITNDCRGPKLSSCRGKLIITTLFVIFEVWKFRYACGIVFFQYSVYKIAFQVHSSYHLEYFLFFFKIIWNV